jgi:electron transport complex protein RnfB
LVDRLIRSFPPHPEHVAARRERVVDRERSEPRWKNAPVRIEPWECIVCDACVRACPPQFGAVFNDGVEVRVIPELCAGCDRCVRVCPVDCIYPDPDWSATASERLWSYAHGATDPYANERDFDLA